jgi:hypothetical protein
MTTLRIYVVRIFIENIGNSNEDKMMKDEQIEAIRKKYPVSYEELNMYSSFEQILGRNKDDYTHDERKRRWNKVMSTSKKMARRWSDTTACNGCIHLKDAWCDLQDLPCTVNSVLSFRCGIIGMACFGAGKVKREPTLFDDDDILENNSYK